MVKAGGIRFIQAPIPITHNPGVLMVAEEMLSEDTLEEEDHMEEAAVFMVAVAYIVRYKI